MITLTEKEAQEIMNLISEGTYAGLPVKYPMGIVLKLGEKIRLARIQEEKENTKPS